ncbi:MAG: hypothetical protein AAF699_13545 [Pseudomonadota bacterium]
MFVVAQADGYVREEAPNEHVDEYEITEELIGITPILPYIDSDAMLASLSSTLMVTGRCTNVKESNAVNLFNLVGDADASPQALLDIQSLINAVKPKRCFNPPVHIYKTSRSRLPDTLANIPGCRVPRVEALDPADFAELTDLCRNFGCWPIIVRSRGHHGGKEMVLVNNEEGLVQLKDLEWPYHGVFIIEYLDYQQADGYFAKMRIAMIEGKSYARHCIYSTDWAIHSESRSGIMLEDAELRAQEKQTLQEMRDKRLNDIKPTLDEIYRRIKLDVFGIDCTLIGNELVIFEANACMRFFTEDASTNPPFEYLEPYEGAVRTAVKKMLLKK